MLVNFPAGRLCALVSSLVQWRCRELGIARWAGVMMTRDDGCRFAAAGRVMVFILLSLGWHPRAYAEPEVLVTETVCPVYGNTEAKIRHSLDQNSPVRQNNKSFDAYTQWDIDWPFRWVIDGNGTCRLTRVRTQIRIHHTLPGLSTHRYPAGGPGAPLGTISDALTAHEAGHAAIGIDAARVIEQRLAQMAPRSSCDQLGSDANALARDIIARYARMDDRFAADTRFGERDGARFP